MTTVTWSTATLPVHKLAAGDRITIYGPHARFTREDVTVEWVSNVGAVVTLHLSNGLTLEGPDRGMVEVHVPDEPVDGYGLWRPKPHVWPSGCTCLSRRGQDGNWATIATDPDCRWCNQQDWED